MKKVIINTTGLKFPTDISASNIPKYDTDLFDRFNGFDLDEHIKKIGVEQLREDIKWINQVMEQIDLDALIRQGFERAMIITDQLDEVPIKEVRFINAGYRTDARAMGEDFFVINMGNICNRGKDIDSIEERLLGLVSHESVHIILRALKIRPPKSDSYYPDLIHKCWEEGLTTYIETSHLPWHEEYKQDWEFWMKILQEWNSVDNKGRIILLNRCFNNTVYQKYHKKFIENYREMIENDEDLEDILFDIYFYANGPGYHLGCRLWEIQTSTSDLIELVKGGHTQAYDWMEINEK